MRGPKFTLNALTGIVLIFSLLILLFSVKLTETADRSVVNDFVPVEGTKVAVCNGTYRPSGLYEGDSVTGVLRVPGTFGYEWGAAAVGDTLYLNEYHRSELGLMYCSLVKVDLLTYEKTVLSEDCVLRGRCASGELVCAEGTLLPAAYPEDCALSRLYALTGAATAAVSYRDPETGKVLFRTENDAPEAEWEARYLDATLAEVMG